MEHASAEAAGRYVNWVTVRSNLKDVTDVVTFDFGKDVPHPQYGDKPYDLHIVDPAEPYSAAAAAAMYADPANTVRKVSGVLEWKTYDRKFEIDGPTFTTREDVFF